MKNDYYFLNGKSQQEFVSDNQESLNHTKVLLCEMTKAYRNVLKAQQLNPSDGFSDIQKTMKNNYGFIKNRFKDLYLID